MSRIGRGKGSEVGGSGSYAGEKEEKNKCCVSTKCRVMDTSGDRVEEIRGDVESLMKRSVDIE